MAGLRHCSVDRNSGVPWERRVMHSLTILPLNIDRYRRLFESETDPDRCRQITMMLHESEAAEASLLAVRAAEPRPTARSGEITTPAEVYRSGAFPHVGRAGR
jgi:hypothetical protein